MTVDHFITQPEMLLNCIYCGNKLDLSKWKSSFCVSRHYKEVKCSCGKVHRTAVDFCGSGHDDWAKEVAKEANGENIIDKVNGK
jgi:hypothetical protein